MKQQKYCADGQVTKLKYEKFLRMCSISLSFVFYCKCPVY